MAFCFVSLIRSRAVLWFICYAYILGVTQSQLGQLDQSAAAASEEDPPQPRAWPPQFHAILVMNYTGELQLIDLWYDWPNGRNFNIIRHQLGTLLYDLEWNNGTSFFYTLDPDPRGCRSAKLEVGILRPNWLDGATYLGQRHVDGFLCNVWQKVDFIWYYEDVVSKRPVHWVFYTVSAMEVVEAVDSKEKMMSVGLLIAMTLVVAKLISALIIPSARSRKRLPPVVKAWPLVLGGLLRFLKGPIVILHQEYSEHGGVFTLNTEGTTRSPS